MSGYFARLAAQVASPAATPGARAAASPSLLEQHAELTAPMATTAPPLRLGKKRQPSSLPGALPEQQAQPPEEAAPIARPAERRTEAAVDFLPLPDAMAWPRHLQTSKPALASRLTQLQNEAPAANKALAPLTTAQTHTTSSSPRQPSDMPLPQVRPDLIKEAPSTLASPSSLDLTRQNPEPQEQSLAWQVPEQVPSVGSPFKVRPVQPAHQRGSLPTIKPSNPGEAMPRTHVRIGTITLEVRAANPAPVIVPQPQPAAEPTPAPARFALRRHHVRWS